MSTTKKIYNQALELEALFAEGLKRATTLRENLEVKGEGRKTSSPGASRRTATISRATIGRNKKLGKLRIAV